MGFGVSDSPDTSVYPRRIVPTLPEGLPGRQGDKGPVGDQGPPGPPSPDYSLPDEPVLWFENALA